MCLFGGGQPSAPVNKPAEAPEDSWKTVESTVTTKGTAPANKVTAQPIAAAPASKPSQSGVSTARIRM